ncbi:MAG: 3'-5' exonuclease, partial [Acidimicrobiales bacterium]
DRSWSDQAVLARTNGQLQVIARALDRAGIPFRMVPAPEMPIAGVPAPGGYPTRQPRPAGGSQGVADAVELATFHRAKGLEWDSVYVVGVEEGFVPIVHAAAPAAIDEERRLLYVALTRASRRLHCSWARSRSIGAGRRVEREPSPWLAAVARVSTTGDREVKPVDTGQRIAELRSRLDR